MNEWTVVTVLIALVGLLAAILRPLLGLNSTIIRLTEAVDALKKELSHISSKNSEAHSRLWKQLNEQEKRLSVCESRLDIEP